MTNAVALPTSGALTFLFTDIEGSTRKAHELGDAWFAVLEAHHALLRPIFAAHGGFEVSTAGDSFFIVFADAAKAIVAAVEMQRALAAHDWSPTPPVKVRMGMHTGLARFRPHDNDYAGLTVHTASRVESAAAGAQVLITQSTREAATDGWPAGVDALDLGAHRLKDLPSEVQVFQLAADGLEREFPPVRGLDVVRNNVPVPPSSFVGRTEELSRLHRLIDDNRLVTVIGPGGTGKTRIALRLASERLHRHGDGVWFVELASTGDEAGVVNAIAHALGVREAGSNTLIESLVEHVQRQEVLLVVDNCEHVVDAAAAVVERLLSSGRGVRVLATSREPLELDGERIWPLPPLSVDEYGGEALSLLAARLELADPNFVLDDVTRADAVTIALRLDGLPLALELAAASASTLSLAEIAEQLDDRFALLTRGKRTALERQKTLWGAIDWSYSLLDDDERSLFHRLAVFPAEFDFGVVHEVCGAGLDVENLLFALQRKSLVAESPSTRLRLLESIRAYAGERLAESGEADVIAERHARWFVASADADPSPEVSLWVDTIHADLSSALEWGGEHDVDIQLRALNYLLGFWLRRGQLSHAAAAAAHVLDALPDDAIGARWHACSQAGRIALSQGDTEAAQRYFMRTARLAEAFGTAEQAELALGDLGQVALREGDLDSAQALLERALTAARRGASDQKIAVSLTHLANVASQRGDSTHARQLALEALEVARALQWGELDLALTNLLGVLARQRGDLVEARQVLSDALALATKLQNDDAKMFLLYCLASVELDDANPAPARAYLRDAIALGHESGARADLAECLEAVARMAVDDDPALAAALLATADRLRAETHFVRKPIDEPIYQSLLTQLAGRVAEPLELDAAVAHALAFLAEAGAPTG